MRLLFALLMFCATPLRAQDTDLELVLLADASGSITEAEIRFQRQGYAQAITDPEVLTAIRTTAYGSIAVTYVEWAANQQVVVPWTRIATAEDAEAFAAALLAPPRQAFGRNAIGAALLRGRDLIEGNEIDGWRKVIDFSGDSPNSYSGPPVAAARDEVVAAGITINALAIPSERYVRNGRNTLPDIYRDRIIGGFGAFVEAAETRDDFAEAVKRKLILEIAGPAGRPRDVAGR
ncbi:DUF1194 domain-containing protein [Jannaschia aquimarina]|uniref:DUF1194 domain-containing protein n=1 Tax=Jannaschia aquimarina TaxID=935700 RepID=A0A0D1EHS2_9RHOB|nr:DUF1194 domain-containing protein [Jannaschia aquimarina]KIT17214.1 hypothetical protein jaqu_09450 [Jannaschia aquimarina]SNT18540.1 Protein of unknown function [Jannaschia aquimarina]